MMDSGGENGRAWQRNQDTGIQFGQGLRIDSAGGTIPVQDYMEHCFLRTREAATLQALLLKAVRRADKEAALEYYHRGLIQDALEAMGCEADPDSRKGWDWWNTYNDETDLSQTLQLLTFKRGDTLFALVQVHQGADVRGGYTDGTLYEVPDRYAMYDCRAEVEDEDGSGDMGLYYATEKGLTWIEERKRWEWPNGDEADWSCAATGYKIAQTA